MILERIHSGSNGRRQVPISELLGNFIFNGYNPKRFISGLNYTAGDYVYEVSNSGISTIYMCLNSGIYEQIDTTNWTIATITSMISQQLDQRLNDYNKTLGKVEFLYDTYITGDLDVIQNKIKLPDTCTEYSRLILFLDGKYVSSDLDEYEITIRNHMKYIETSKDFSDYILYVMTPKNHTARLITCVDLHPTSVSVTGGNLSIYIPGELQMFSYALNVYVDGLYLAPDAYQINYDESTDSIEIQIARRSSLPVNVDQYIVSVISSRTSFITVKETSVSLPIQAAINRYRIDSLPNDDKIYDCPLVFCDGSARPSNYFTIRNNAMSVMSSDYCGEIGETYAITSYTFTVSSDPTITKSGSIVVDEDERKIAIPIVGYDDSVDILVFRKAGTVVTQNRYYVHDGSISLYDHDDSVRGGDLITIRVLNSDPSVCVCSRIETVRADRTIVIPEDLKNSQFLLFSTDGRYIGKHLYNTTTGLITLINGCELMYGDMVEIVYNNYTEAYTKTVTKVASTVVKTQDQFILPVKVYGTNDDYIIFNATTGYLIQPSNYKIMANGVVEITGGTTVSVGDMIDVYISREIRNYIYTNALDRIIDNI